MTALARKKWSIVTILLHLVKHLNSQIPVPMMGLAPPPMYAVAPAVHVVAMPIAVEMKRKSSTTTTTTTTTTTERPIAFAVPVPMAFGVPMSVGYGVPIPQPAPPPVVMVPIPRISQIRLPRQKYILPSSSESSSSYRSCGSSESSSTDTDSISSDSSTDFSWRKKRRRRRRRSKKWGIGRKGRSRKKKLGRLNMRRNVEDEISSLSSNDDFVKPILSFRSDNGKVKIEKRLSHQQAEDLLKEHKPKNNAESRSQRVQIMSRKNPDDQAVSHGNGEGRKARRSMSLNNGLSSHNLGKGKKQLVFKPMDFKKIANLSVSFQVV